MLTIQQEQLWNEYLGVEASGTRDAKLRALESFVAHLTQSPLTDWESWARDLAERVVDRNEEIPIRMPLFRDVVFPALLKGHRDQLPGCARWLAGLSQHIYRATDCQRQLCDEEQTERGLLRAALLNDPSDQSSARRLIKVLADRLWFSLHELPAGVLYGMDGATADQCLELQEELKEFQDLVQQHDQLVSYQSLIADCQYHFRHYHAYLLRRDDFTSYSDFLARMAP